MIEESRADRRKRYVCPAAVWALLFFLYFCGIKNYLLIPEEEAVSLFLCREYPDDREAEEILLREKESEASADVCFYRDSGLQTVRQPDYGRQTRVLVGEIRGNSGNFDSRAAGLGETDTDGCIVDEDTAECLFGSASPGGRLALGEKIYTVRRVVPWKQRFLLIRPVNETVSYSRVLLRRKPGESPAETAELFLMRNRLLGVPVQSMLPQGAALLMLLLLPAGMLAKLFLCGFRMDKEGKFRLWTGASALAVVLLLYCIFHAVLRTPAFPVDWLPPAWSDFGFWRQKLYSEAEALRLYLLFPKTVPELERMLAAGRAVLSAGAAFVLFITRAPFLQKISKNC